MRKIICLVTLVLLCGIAIAQTIKTSGAGSYVQRGSPLVQQADGAYVLTSEGTLSSLTISSSSTTNETILSMSASVNSDYVQANITNSSPTGNACYTATANNGVINGSGTTGFVSMCQNNSSFSKNTAYDLGAASDSQFLSLTSGSMWIGNGTSGKGIYLVTGGVTTLPSSAFVRMTIAGDGSVMISGQTTLTAAKATTGFRTLCINSSGLVFSVAAPTTCGSGT